MRRTLLHLILMLSMCWQALAFAGVGVLVADAQEQAHELLHFQAIPHHHDDHHGGLHEDDSTASAVHIVVDGGVFSAALLPGACAALISSIQGRPPADMARAWPSAYLAGLERPPRLAV